MAEGFPQGRDETLRPGCVGAPLFGWPGRLAFRNGFSVQKLATAHDP